MRDLLFFIFQQDSVQLCISARWALAIVSRLKWMPDWYPYVTFHALEAVPEAVRCWCTERPAWRRFTTAFRRAASWPGEFAVYRPSTKRNRGWPQWTADNCWLWCRWSRFDLHTWNYSASYSDVIQDQVELVTSSAVSCYRTWLHGSVTENVCHRFIWRRQPF